MADPQTTPRAERWIVQGDDVASGKLQDRIKSDSAITEIRQVARDVVVLAMSFFDGQTELEPRILAPLHMLLLMLVACLVGPLVASMRAVRGCSGLPGHSGRAAALGQRTRAPARPTHPRDQT